MELLKRPLALLTWLDLSGVTGTPGGTTGSRARGGTAGPPAVTDPVCLYHLFLPKNCRTQRRKPRAKEKLTSTRCGLHDALLVDIFVAPCRKQTKVHVRSFLDTFHVHSFAFRDWRSRKLTCALVALIEDTSEQFITLVTGCGFIEGMHNELVAVVCCPRRLSVVPGNTVVISEPILLKTPFTEGTIGRKTTDSHGHGNGVDPLSSHFFSFGSKSVGAPVLPLNQHEEVYPLKGWCKI